jgi:hypothetical protein
VVRLGPVIPPNSNLPALLVVDHPAQPAGEPSATS